MGTSSIEERIEMVFGEIDPGIEIDSDGDYVLYLQPETAVAFCDKMEPLIAFGEALQDIVRG